MERVESTAGLSEAQPMPAIALPISIPADNGPLPLAEELPTPVKAIGPIDEQTTAGETVESTATIAYLIAPTASRRLAESLVLFISAILFLRAMAVEPFGVPTGSMAPTLTGNHKVAKCPTCGYMNLIGEPSKQHAQPPKATCANCGTTEIDISQAPDVAGDRLLVDKNIYALRSPRRWGLPFFAAHPI